MREPGEPKKGIKPPEEAWNVGPKEKYGSLDEARKSIEKGKPPEKGKKIEVGKKVFGKEKEIEFEKLEKLGEKWEAEGKKTEKELEEELQKARESREKIEKEKTRQELEKKFGKREGEKARKIEKEGGIVLTGEKGLQEIAKEMAEKEKKKLELEARKKETIKEVVKEKIPEKYRKSIGDLVGRDDEKTLGKIDAIPVLKYQAMAFAGSASPESRQFVKDNIENRAALPWLPFALMGDNTPEGWKLRDNLEIDKKFDKQGIVKSEEVRGGKLWNLIEKLGRHKSKNFGQLADNVNSLTPWPGWFLAPRHIIESTIGIRLDESLEKVELLKKYRKSAPRAALECLRGDNSSQTKKLADKIYGKDKTHQGDPKLRDVYNAYQKSIEKLPSAEK